MRKIAHTGSRFSLPGFDEIASAASSLAMCLLFLAAAVAFSLFGIGFISYLLILLQVEFFVVHSSANIGIILESRLRRLIKSALVLFFSGLYMVIIWFAVSRYSVTWPLWAFAGLTISRIAGIYIGSDPDSRAGVIKSGWAVSVFFYIVLMAYVMPLFMSDRAPVVPRNPELAGKAPWANEPRLAIAFGFLYFAITGLSALFAHSWLGWIWGRRRPGEEAGYE